MNDARFQAFAASLRNQPRLAIPSLVLTHAKAAIDAGDIGTLKAIVLHGYVVATGDNLMETGGGE